MALSNKILWHALCKCRASNARACVAAADPRAFSSTHFVRECHLLDLVCVRLLQGNQVNHHCFQDLHGKTS